MTGSFAERGRKTPWYKKERGGTSLEKHNGEVAKGDGKDGGKDAKPAPANMANFFVFGSLPSLLLME
jgi:hypothetical protein